jgi:hypothetical protein
MKDPLSPKLLTAATCHLQRIILDAQVGILHGYFEAKHEVEVGIEVVTGHA